MGSSSEFDLCETALTEHGVSDGSLRRSSHRSAVVAIVLLGLLTLCAPASSVSARAGSASSATWKLSSTAATTDRLDRAGTDQAPAIGLMRAKQAAADPRAPEPAAGSGDKYLPVWTLDLFDPSAERWQDPDMRACTAASTLSMLNTALDAEPAGMFWHPTTSFEEQEEILAYERDHMTMSQWSAGSDPHGWRNALNYFGWGSMQAGVYVDSAYPSLEAAAKATVSAIAIYDKPVGILAHAGGHAQFVTGYRVIGDDPRTGSANFKVQGIYLTDPLSSQGRRDTWISYADWTGGGPWVRFSPYLESDSPYVDPIDGHVGTSEWYDRWVIIDPVR
jgi:hypothetical protein